MENALPVMHFTDQASFEDWLEKHHDTSKGIRLKIAKKNSRISSISYAEAVESALCFGWVDSQKEAIDDKEWIQRFTPRRPRSIWSKINKEKIELLMESGRIRPSGLNAIEMAKQNGQWDKAYEPASRSSLPEDFAVELERNSKAKVFYESLDRQNKYAIMFRIHSAKKQETRMKRIQQYIEMLEKGEKLHP